MTYRTFLPFLSLVIVPIFLAIGCHNKRATAEGNIESTPVSEPSMPPNDLSESTSKPLEVEEGLVIDYRRGACFGTCPIFSLKIYDNGRAIYTGKNFVEMIGTYYSNFSKSEIDEIFSTAENIGFFDMDSVYDNPHITDLPTVYCTLVKNGVAKQVNNRYNGPKELRKLYSIMDELILQHKWELSQTPSVKE